MSSTTKKVYVIEVQLDNARQQLADALQKLQQLDAQLEGLDKESEAGKKLVAEMAAAAKAVQSLTGEVQDLSDGLDALKPGSVGALEKQVEELERAWKRTTIGTKESEEALLALGNAKGQLKELGDRIDALDPSEKAAAFVDFTNGIVGGFSIATVAATQWGGLSTESAEKVDAAMQQLMVVMSGFEAISKGVSGETLTNVKNMYTLGKAYLFGAESASTASKITRAALVATGIGAIILLVGVLIANWDSFKTKFGGSEKLFLRIREVASGVFSGMLASLKNVGEVVTKLWDGDFSGAVAKAKHIGQDIAKGYSAGMQEVLEEENRKLLQKQIEHQEQLLKVQQAGGFDTTKLQRKILAAKLAVLKNGTEEEKKAHEAAAADLAAFDAAQAKKRREDALAVTLARLNGVVALEQAKGQESYREQLNAKRRELTGLLAAETRNDAAITAKQREIAAFRAQHDTQQADNRRALLVQAQQQEVALLGQQGKDTLDLRVTLAERLLTYDTDILAARAKQHTQASEKEVAQARASSDALLLVQAEYDEKVRAGLAENQAQRQDLLLQGREVDKKFMEGTADLLADAANKSLQKKDFDLGGTILTKFFGVKPEDVDKVKEDLNKAFTEIASGVGGAVNAMLTSGITEAQAQLDAVQSRLQELDSQLSQASSARESTQAALDNATGARKTYLLERLEKERAAEAKLANERAKAAREAEAAAKTKAKLEKEQQQISAASTAIEAVLLGIKAAQQIVDIASKGKFGVDNLVLAVAAAATLGAGIFAMKNAAKSFGGGGIIEGGSHASGNDVPVFGGRYRVEGGEMITNVKSTQNNTDWLDFINSEGKNRRLTTDDFVEMGLRAGDVARSVIPTPASYSQPGGLLYKGGIPGGQASAADMGALAARLDQQSGLLAQVVAHLGNVVEGTIATASATAATASHTGAIKAYGPPVLAFGHEAEQKRRELSDGMDQAEGHATL
jgi:hypothetical protein